MTDGNQQGTGTPPNSPTWRTIAIAAAVAAVFALLLFVWPAARDSVTDVGMSVARLMCIFVAVVSAVLKRDTLAVTAGVFFLGLK